MWSKLVRLNALACTTSAYDKLLGEIRSTPALRADLVGAIEEACAVGQAEGADDIDPADGARRARARARHARQLDAARHRRRPRARAGRDPRRRCCARRRATACACPTIERLVAMIAARAGVPAPVIAG